MQSHLSARGSLLRLLFVCFVTISISASSEEPLLTPIVCNASTYTTYVNSKHHVSILAVDSTYKPEELSFSILPAPFAFSHVPFDVFEERAFGIFSSKPPNQPSIMWGILLEDIRSSYSTPAKHSELYYDRIGKLITPTVIAQPLLSIQRSTFYRIESPSTNWDVRTFAKDDTRLYVLNGSRLTSWRAPKEDWLLIDSQWPKPVGDGWVKQWSVSSPFSSPFRILSDSVGSTMICSASGAVYRLVGEMLEQVHHFGDDQEHERLVVHVDRSSGFLIGVQSLQKEDSSCVAFDMANLKSATLNRDMKRKINTVLQLRNKVQQSDSVNKK